MQFQRNPDFVRAMNGRLPCILELRPGFDFSKRVIRTRFLPGRNLPVVISEINRSLADKAMAEFLHRHTQGVPTVIGLEIKLQAA